MCALFNVQADMNNIVIRYSSYSGLGGVSTMTDGKTGWGSIPKGESDKVRMTLLLKPGIKEELKRQAKEMGVSPSAYISVLVGSKGK